jgi:hypothetical protein
MLTLLSFSHSQENLLHVTYFCIYLFTYCGRIRRLLYVVFVKEFGLKIDCHILKSVEETLETPSKEMEARK